MSLWDLTGLLIYMQSKFLEVPATTQFPNNSKNKQQPNEAAVFDGAPGSREI